jgi:hypothetical protein
MIAIRAFTSGEIRNGLLLYLAIGLAPTALWLLR